MIRGKQEKPAADVHFLDLTYNIQAALFPLFLESCQEKLPLRFMNLTFFISVIKLLVHDAKKTFPFSQKTSTRPETIGSIP
jgi:hypothetical protein